MTTIASEPKFPFLDGKTKDLFIDNEFVEAQSGKTIEAYNPATGGLL